MKKDPGIIKFKLDPERDARIDRERMHQACGVIWERWTREFINKPKTPLELPSAVAELLFRIQTATAGHPEVGAQIIPMIEEKIAILQQGIIASRETVELLVDCPHDVTIVTETSKCGWGGIARFHKSHWENKTAIMTCPKCGKLLEVKDMALKSEIDAMAPKDDKIVPFPGSENSGGVA